MRRVIALLFPVVALLWVLAGCSDDEMSACTAAQKLAASVDALREVDVVATGTEGLERALGDVDSAWTDFKDAAGDQFGPQLDDLREAIDTAKDDLSSLGSNDSIGDALGTIELDIEALDRAWNTLADAISAEFSDCDLGRADS